MTYFESKNEFDYSSNSAENTPAYSYFANKVISSRELAANGWSFEDLEFIFI